MPQYTIIMSEKGGAKILKNGKYYFIIGVYVGTPEFKVQEIAQQVVKALNAMAQE